MSEHWKAMWRDTYEVTVFRTGSKVDCRMMRAYRRSRWWDRAM